MKYAILILVLASIHIYALPQDSEKLLAQLRKIPLNSSQAPWAMLEAAKIYYREQQWGHFFGISFFARKKFPDTKETDKLKLLETLALIRHCQWEFALELAKEGERLSKPPEKDQFTFLLEFLPLATSLPTKNNPAKDTTTPSRRRLWPVRTLQKVFLDPFKYNRIIEPLCLEKKKASND